MDPLLDRFHRLLRSMFRTPDGDYDFYIHESDPYEDRDYQEAWEELESFLGGSSSQRSSDRGNGGYTGREEKHSGFDLPPEELRDDYKLLGVPFGAEFPHVKAAHRSMLKRHHPDHHAGDPEMLKRATKMTQNINYSFGRMRAWEIARGQAV